jgi:hypothetical protein
MPLRRAMRALISTALRPDHRDGDVSWSYGRVNPPWRCMRSTVTTDFGLAFSEPQRPMPSECDGGSRAGSHLADEPFRDFSCIWTRNFRRLRLQRDMVKKAKTAKTATKKAKKAEKPQPGGPSISFDDALWRLVNRPKVAMPKAGKAKAKPTDAD